jgi:hypothetical protein
MDFAEVLIEKCFAKSTAGVSQQRRYWPTGERGVEPINAFRGGKVCFDRLHNGAANPQFVRRSVNLQFVGGTALPSVSHHHCTFSGTQAVTLYSATASAIAPARLRNLGHR